MAIRTGILGKIRQTADGVTFSNWKGKNVMKAKVPDRNSSKSPGQVLTRTKFALLAQLAGTLGNALRVGFRTSAIEMTEQNVFTSRNSKFVTVSPQGVASIDYEQMIISSGNVEIVVLTGVTVAGGGNSASIAWANNSNGASALPDDNVILVALNTLTNATNIEFTSGVRADGGGAIAVPGLTAANQADFMIYAYAKRAKTTATSNSTNRQM